MHVSQANAILCCTHWILLTPMLTDCIRYALRGARALFPILLNVFCRKRFKTIAHEEWSDVQQHRGFYRSWLVYFTGFIYSILPAWSHEKTASHFPCHHVPSRFSSGLRAGSRHFHLLAFLFDLALLHAHQSSPCSKWRIPHAEDYLMQLTSGPQRGICLWAERCAESFRLRRFVSVFRGHSKSRCWNVINVV